MKCLGVCAFFSALIVFCNSGCGHISSPCTKNNKYLVTQPVLTLHSKPLDSASFETQTIYGHQVYIIETIDQKWAFVEMEDGYRGYARVEGLIGDEPVWRTHRNLCRTHSVASLVYPIASTIQPHILKLPFDSKVVLVKDIKASNDRWLEVVLVGGKKGWIQRGDIERIKPKSLKEVLCLSHTFAQLPYTWGGASSQGFDCSGYVQTLFKQMGILLPRDSRPQSESDKTERLEIPEKPGDLIFFGNNKVSHVGMYLGDGDYIHSGVWDHQPKITTARLEDASSTVLVSCRVKDPVYNCVVRSINEDIKARLIHSWRDDNPVPMEHLRYIQLSHWGFDGYIHTGELIVHENVVVDVVGVFQELFDQQYPIEKMLLIDEYLGNDDLSCEDNNSSSFCSRFAVGKNEWSYHSFGCAIDINPLLNPYHRNNVVIPDNGKPFLDRNIPCQGVISHEDPCYRAFIARGWKWGGDWFEQRGYVDFQHFYKEQ